MRLEEKNLFYGDFIQNIKECTGTIFLWGHTRKSLSMDFMSSEDITHVKKIHYHNNFVHQLGNAFLNPSQIDGWNKACLNVLC